MTKKSVDHLKRLGAALGLTVRDSRLPEVFIVESATASDKTFYGLVTPDAGSWWRTFDNSRNADGDSVIGWNPDLISVAELCHMYQATYSRASYALARLARVPDEVIHESLEASV